MKIHLKTTIQHYTWMEETFVGSFVYTIYPMCVCIYIYMCIYIPYTLNEVKHFHKLISTELATSFSPRQYIYNIYRTTGSLLLGLTLGDTAGTVPSTPVLRGVPVHMLLPISGFLPHTDRQPVVCTTV